MGDPLLKTEKYRCYLCGRWIPTEKHHIFGAANRKHSEKLGLYVYLCHNCHNEPPNGVHYNPAARHRLQAEGQRAFEERFMYEYRCNHEEARNAFMRVFGKNFMEE